MLFVFFLYRDEYGHTSTVGIGGHMFPLEISGLVSPLDPNLDQKQTFIMNDDSQKIQAPDFTSGHTAHANYPLIYADKPKMRFLAPGNRFR